MKSLFIFIGSFVITAILFSIPVITALSFVFDWDNCFKFLLVIFAAGEFILTTTFIWIETKQMEDE